jgi:hypothetical protein
MYLVIFVYLYWCPIRGYFLVYDSLFKKFLADFPVYIHINNNGLSKTTHYYLCVYIPKNLGKSILKIKINWIISVVITIRIQ